MKQNAITNTLDMSEVRVGCEGLSLCSARILNSLRETRVLEQVYEMGRYFWGVGKSAQKYPRGYQIVDFGGANELSVFDKKGLEVILGSSFQYRCVR